MSSKIHFQHQLEHWAHSAWSRLELEAPCDLQAVCDYLRVRVEHIPMARDLHGVFFKLPNESKAIRVNSSLPRTRQRFVLAHEIGHALLTHSKPGELCVSLKADCKGPNERACDLFAVNLLMPEIQVREICSTLGHPYNADKTRTIAEKFGVSHSAMRIRLQSLGLAYIPPAR